MGIADQQGSLEAENAALRARVEQLELELQTFRADTVATLSEAQQSLYWFERWGVDFNRHMARPQVEGARKAFRALRSVYRALVKAKRSALN